MCLKTDAAAHFSGVLFGGAIGEALGLLVSQTSTAEAAERFSSEGIHDLTLDPASQVIRSSQTVGLLLATISALRVATATESASNVDIRTSLHEAYSDWLRTSPTALKFQNARFAQALGSGPLGSLSHMERGSADALLHIAPIGLQFASDPGRAFHIGSEAAALADANFNSYLCAGVLVLIVALVADGASLQSAIRDSSNFVRPIEGANDVSEALWDLSRGEDFHEGHLRFVGAAAQVLISSLSAVQASKCFVTAMSNILLKEGSVDAVSLTGQLAGVLYGPEKIPPRWRSDDW